MTTLAEVFRDPGHGADASLAQIPHSHFVFLDAASAAAAPRRSSEYFFAEALAGASDSPTRSPSAAAGRSSTIQHDAHAATTTAPTRLDGEKFYCTGALFADWLVVRAVLDGEAPLANGTAAEVGRVRAARRARRHGRGRLGRGRPAHHGQRHRPARRRGRAGPRTSCPTRRSSTSPRRTARARRCCTPRSTSASPAARSTPRSPRSPRPGHGSRAGADRAADDPLLVQQAGELEIAVRGAEALLREAAAAIDRRRVEPGWTDDQHGRGVRCHRRGEGGVCARVSTVGRVGSCSSWAARARAAAGAEPVALLARRPHPHPARPEPLEGPARRSTGCSTARRRRATACSDPRFLVRPVDLGRTRA